MKGGDGAAALLNERLATPETEYEVGEGVWFYAGKRSAIMFTAASA